MWDVIVLITDHCLSTYFAISAILYRIGLPSNIATPLAFVRIELLCLCSCIRQQTLVATNTANAAQIMTRSV